MAFGLDADTLNETLQAILDFAHRTLPKDRVLDLDHEDECPVDMVRAMCGDELGIQLLFIPEEYGGMGGGDLRRLPRLRGDGAASTSGVATSVLATFLGSDPIVRRRHARPEEALAQPRSPRRACCSPTARPSPRPAATSAR